MVWVIQRISYFITKLSVPSMRWPPTMENSIDRKAEIDLERLEKLRQEQILTNCSKKRRIIFMIMGYLTISLSGRRVAPFIFFFFLSSSEKRALCRCALFAYSDGLAEFAARKRRQRKFDRFLPRRERGRKHRAPPACGTCAQRGKPDSCGNGGFRRRMKRALCRCALFARLRGGNGKIAENPCPALSVFWRQMCPETDAKVIVYSEQHKNDGRDWQKINRSVCCKKSSHFI